MSDNRLKIFLSGPLLTSEGERALLTILIKQHIFLGFETNFLVHPIYKTREVDDLRLLHLHYTVFRPVEAIHRLQVFLLAHVLQGLLVHGIPSAEHLVVIVRVIGHCLWHRDSVV